MSTSEPNPNFLVAGFWRRLGAFLVDGLVLGAIGFAISLAFEDALIRLGPWGRLLGFLVALSYFGLLNSRLSGGRTPGKRLLKIKVIAKDGSAPTLPMAFLRFLPLGLPWFLNNAQFSESVLFSSWIYILSIAIFGLGLSVFYLSVFNRSSRQSLHDLLVGSYVVREESTDLPPPTTLPLPHQIACAFLILAAAIAPYFTQSLIAKEPFSSIADTYRAVSAEPGITSAQVYKTTTQTTGAGTGGNTSHSLAITAYSTYADINNAEHAVRLARRALSADKSAARLDSIQVNLVHGYDIGIWSSWQSQSYAYPPADWLAGKIPAQ